MATTKKAQSAAAENIELVTMINAAATELLGKIYDDDGPVEKLKGLIDDSRGIRELEGQASRNLASIADLCQVKEWDDADQAGEKIIGYIRGEIAAKAALAEQVRRMRLDLATAKRGMHALTDVMVRTDE